MIGGKGLDIPKGGWTASAFAAHGVLLLRTMVRAAQITQRRAAPIVASHAMKVFRMQLDRIISMATGAGKGATKDPSVTLMFPQHETLWRMAIAEVMRDTRLDTIIEIVPPVQSVMAQANSRTALLLGEEADPATNQRIARDARAIAARITRINDTTRNQIEAIVRNAIAENMTVAETAAQMREELPKRFSSRVLTIARTELNNAWTQGSANTFKASRTVTHVSIIGCQAREPASPQWQGESTCNYPDLPVNEIDELLAVGFHVNHTGTMVPSRFRDDDGGMDPAAPRPDLLDEQSQAEG